MQMIYTHTQTRHADRQDIITDSTRVQLNMASSCYAAKTVKGHIASSTTNQDRVSFHNEMEYRRKEQCEGVYGEKRYKTTGKTHSFQTKDTREMGSYLLVHDTEREE